MVQPSEGGIYLDLANYRWRARTIALPAPVGRQKEVLYLPARGHVVVLGTAGSGKTTLAILRSAYLASPRLDHAGRTLLVTFNKALVAYLRHLQDRQLSNVSVENYHLFARGYLDSRGKMSYGAICDNAQRRGLVEAAVASLRRQHGNKPLFEVAVESMCEEIRWISQHGIASADDYAAAERVGRSAMRLDRASRPLMFEIYQEYLKRREKGGKLYDWDDLASAVCAEFLRDNTKRLYRHIVIDEGQDFSPEMIRSLALAIPADGSLTFFGDMAQQIYGHRMSWRSAGLTVSKVWEFKENYRNTRQIARLGLAISKMSHFKDVPDLVEPVAPTADGPLPTLVKCSSVEREISLVVDQAVRGAATQSVAILFRNHEDESVLKRRLPRNSIHLHGDMTTWQAGPGIRYGTYHSAKGLEFDTVILPFFTADRLPDPDRIDVLGDEDAKSQDGRLVYVGVTRAKARLIITYSDAPTSLIPNDDVLYERLARD